MNDIKETAVLVVDIQGDFTTACVGSLAVEGTDQVYLAAVEARTRQYKAKGYPIIATQDWHPADHISFFTNHKGKSAFDTIDLSGRAQILWPPHCVQDTDKARILLEKDLFDAVVRKGTDPGFDSYSGFFDDGGHGTGLETLLRDKGIRRLIIYGLTTDYCARATAMDARALGFEVEVILGLCRGVGKETTRAALEQMAAARVVLKQN